VYFHISVATSAVGALRTCLLFRVMTASASACAMEEQHPRPEIVVGTRFGDHLSGDLMVLGNAGAGETGDASR